MVFLSVLVVKRGPSPRGAAVPKYRDISRIRFSYRKICVASRRRKAHPGRRATAEAYSVMSIKPTRNLSRKWLRVLKNFDYVLSGQIRKGPAKSIQFLLREFSHAARGGSTDSI